MSLVERAQPPAGHVHLVLYPSQPPQPNAQPENEFYLEIPISFIQLHYRSHLKFLQYLGWCILGEHGALVDDQYQRVDLNGQLEERATYYYYTQNQDDIFLHAVDLEAVKTRSRYNSAESSTRDAEFRRDLLLRDEVCVFSGCEDVVGMHIIPHSKGTDWIQHIVANRPLDEPTHDITTDDIQNGMLCTQQVNGRFDSRRAVILKTPNAILDEDDLQPRCQRQWPLPLGHAYPTDARYTLHHIDQPVSDALQSLMPDNNDAAFLTTSDLRKPSGLLLNYSYAATAVKRWGRNVSILFKRTLVFRPGDSAAAMVASKTPGGENREKSAKERKLRETGEEGARADGSVDEIQEADGGEDEIQEDDQEWDEDDVILFLWGNSKATRERQQREERNRKTSIENWRSTVVVDTRN